MPVNRINIGSAANDGTGDTLRDAFGKVNENLDSLAAAVASRLLNQWAFAPLRHEHHDVVARYVRNAPPYEPPPTLGAMWVDAAAGRIYLATGTATVENWREIGFVSGNATVPGSGR